MSNECYESYDDSQYPSAKDKRGEHWSTPIIPIILPSAKENRYTGTNCQKTEN